MQASKILVVDDEPLVLMIIQAALQNCGLEIVTKTGASDALLFLEEHEQEIAVVLSDVRMPGMNGPQLVQKVLERNPTTVVALMSGEVGPETLDPHVPLLRKPFDLRALRELVEDLIARQKVLVSGLQTRLERNKDLATEQTQIVKEVQALAHSAGARVVHPAKP